MTGNPLAQCEAKIRETYSLEHSLRGIPYGATPISNIQCSRSSSGDVCGIELCEQHRGKVVEWFEGAERLRERADRIFASWGLERRGPFVGEMGPRAAIANLVRAIQAAEECGALQNLGSTHAWFTFRVNRYVYDAIEGIEHVYDDEEPVLRSKSVYRSDRFDEVGVDVFLVE